MGNIDEKNSRLFLKGFVKVNVLHGELAVSCHINILTYKI